MIMFLFVPAETKISPTLYAHWVKVTRLNPWTLAREAVDTSACARQVDTSACARQEAQSSLQEAERRLAVVNIALQK